MSYQKCMNIFCPLAGALLAAVALSISGCENKEKVLDIETPGAQIEVERDRDTGDVDVEVTDE